MCYCHQIEEIQYFLGNSEMSHFQHLKCFPIQRVLQFFTFCFYLHFKQLLNVFQIGMVFSIIACFGRDTEITAPPWGSEEHCAMFPKISGMLVNMFTNAL